MGDLQPSPCTPELPIRTARPGRKEEEPRRARTSRCSGHLNKGNRQDTNDTKPADHGRPSPSLLSGGDLFGLRPGHYADDQARAKAGFRRRCACVRDRRLSISKASGSEIPHTRRPAGDLRGAAADRGRSAATRQGDDAFYRLDLDRDALHDRIARRPHAQLNHDHVVRWGQARWGGDGQAAGGEYRWRQHESPRPGSRSLLLRASQAALAGSAGRMRGAFHSSGEHWRHARLGLGHCPLVGRPRADPLEIGLQVRMAVE